MGETARMANVAGEVGGAPRQVVSTFWHGGPLPALDLACLRSFVAAGHDVRIYSFHVINDVPDGIGVADAREIVDERLLHAFIVDGKPSISHFSDLFRYRLFLTTGSVWIDTDLVCLPGKQLPTRAFLFGQQAPYSLNGAVMRIPPDDPRLPLLVDRAEKLAGRSMPWGATGPDLVTAVFGREIVTTAPPPSTYYPVHWDEWFMPFLPSRRAECERLCGDAITLHLWNNIVERAGYWKELSPPEGSFLHAKFAELGLLGGFRDIYPERVVNQLYENWRHGVTGDRFRPVEVARIVASRLFRDRHKPLVRKLRTMQAKRRLPKATVARSDRPSRP